jgi:hypothetical protein
MGAKPQSSSAGVGENRCRKAEKRTNVQSVGWIRRSLAGPSDNSPVAPL